MGSGIRFSWEFLVQCYMVSGTIWKISSLGTSYNTRHKSLKQTLFLSNFLETPEIYTSHCFSHWHVPSPFLMLSHAYFEALRPLWYPNQRWGRGKRHKCFKIFDEYCSWQSCPWSLKLMTSQVVEGTWICTGGYRRFRGKWVKSKRFFES